MDGKLYQDMKKDKRKKVVIFTPIILFGTIL